ncbi:hypothetical protein EIP91_001793 [Steccherinum ochraceum]|uniref:Queuosine 5'-phosphate N-glycosylase/hydrolase n=1 Tax=Steccherinum ochraceum TaxID=92696 RepID=A0A4R0S2R8_9APHY|nr:hypothetical protein EIP91_001793 [Steccherinum ochraceum]
MTTTFTAKGHAVLFAHEAWGHTRPLCVLATKIVRHRDVYVTLLIGNELWQRVDDELARSFDSQTAERRRYLRVVGIPPAIDLQKMLLGGEGFDPSGRFASFENTYAKLAQEQPLVCSATQQQVAAVLAPSMVVLDFSVLEAFRIVKKLSNRPVKSIAFLSCASSFPVLHLAPEEYGGFEDKRALIAEEVERTGESENAIAFKHLHNFGDDIVNSAGLPPFHRYELDPQDINAVIAPVVGSMWIESTTVLKDICDGVIATSPEAYEPAATAQLRTWMKDTERDFFCLGPMQALRDGSKRLAAETGAEGIVSFMNRILSERGEKSILFISFGSIFWPTKQEALWAVLDTVMSLKVPFILSHASPFAIIPDEVLSKVKAYGDGLLTKWSPQQTILSHPATGWFLTHGGQNSVIEAISQSVPMICWPFHADQPCNATRLSRSLDVAYELTEVRSGKGLLPLYHTGKAPTGTIEAIQLELRQILEKAWSTEGQLKRGKMQQLQQKVLIYHRALTEPAFDLTLTSILIIILFFWSEKEGREDRFGILWREGWQKDMHAKRTHTGYWSLVAALDRALEEGIPITDPTFYASEKHCPAEVLEHVFRPTPQSTESIPLFQERVKVLREVGTVLSMKYEGSFQVFIEQFQRVHHGRGSALQLVKLVAETFPPFRDETVYNGRRVFIWKRAQILVAELWAAFYPPSPTDPHPLFPAGAKIHQLTMFADYRVPQILHHLNIITYPPSLLKILRGHVMLETGCREELSIRSASIVAVERVKEEMIKLAAERQDSGEDMESEGGGDEISSVLIDFYLWDLAKKVEVGKDSITGIKTVPIEPAHRTRSIWY